jgi:hypothetical protein
VPLFSPSLEWPWLIHLLVFAVFLLLLDYTVALFVSLVLVALVHQEYLFTYYIPLPCFIMTHTENAHLIIRQNVYIEKKHNAKNGRLLIITRTQYYNVI